MSIDRVVSPISRISNIDVFSIYFFQVKLAGGNDIELGIASVKRERFDWPSCGCRWHLVDLIISDKDGRYRPHSALETNFDELQQVVLSGLRPELLKLA